MTFVIIFFCLFCAAFFAGLETGLLSADQLLVYSRRERGSVGARAAYFLLIKPDRLLGTTLIGTNISVVTASVLMTSFIRGTCPEWMIWIGNVGLSLVFLMFSEIIPKSFFRKYADTVAVALAPVLLVFFHIFLPVIIVLNALIRFLLFFFIRNKNSRKQPHTRDDFKLLVRLGTREANFKIPEFKVFEDIFDFRETLAREVMTPLHKLPLCHGKQTTEEAVQIARRTERRFIPIFTGRMDNVTGYFDVESIVWDDGEKVDDVAREIPYYPETISIPDLLMRMNRRRCEVIALVDEYGGIAGLVTRNEIAAEIMGYNPGTRESREEVIYPLGGQRFHVAGIADLEDFEHQVGIRIRPGHYETVGGYLCTRLGRIPKKGETFEWDALRFEITAENGKLIESMTVERIKQAGKVT